MAGAWSWVGAVRVFSWGCGAGVVGTLTFFNKVGYFARVDGKSMQTPLFDDPSKIRTLKYKNRYVKVPTGHIWIEGDHSEVSLDSNIFGPVSLGLLHAKASRIVWPPHRQQKLKSFVPSNRQPVNSKNQNFEQFILDDDDELALSTL
ncbi:mitochondrial inner membrane protease subunit 2-like [Anneissia japonica]|uniref:mitochondrial inner membrane protease subunit 2-like n=1 Tax=Anneissia japonica TaxID=1529436 RepID=UPI0014255C53|nr:mitochondrial inner membrane protease subunit 2-like [Anneissia japonica]